VSKKNKSKRGKHQPRGSQVAQSASQKAKAALVAATKPAQTAKAEVVEASGVVMRLDRPHAPKAVTGREKAAKRSGWLARLLGRGKPA
jgi:hypothetical protein